MRKEKNSKRIKLNNNNNMNFGWLIPKKESIVELECPIWDDLLPIIFSYLECKDLSRVSRSSKRFCVIIKDFTRNYDFPLGYGESYEGVRFNFFRFVSVSINITTSLKSLLSLRDNLERQTYIEQLFIGITKHNVNISDMFPKGKNRYPKQLKMLVIDILFIGNKNFVNQDYCFLEPIKKKLKVLTLIKSLYNSDVYDKYPLNQKILKTMLNGFVLSKLSLLTKCHDFSFLECVKFEEEARFQVVLSKDGVDYSDFRTLKNSSIKEFDICISSNLDHQIIPPQSQNLEKLEIVQVRALICNIPIDIGFCNKGSFLNVKMFSFTLTIDNLCLDKNVEALIQIAKRGKIIFHYITCPETVEGLETSIFDKARLLFSKLARTNFEHDLFSFINNPEVCYWLDKEHKSRKIVLKKLESIYSKERMKYLSEICIE